MTTGVLHNSHYSAHAGDRSLPRVLSKDDRLLAFRRARRHTLLIRALRVLLPLGAIGVIGLYLVPSGTAPVLREIPTSIDGIDLSTQGLKMINPHYNGGDDKNGRYSIGAEYAMQNISNLRILELHKITARIDHPDKNWTRLTAARGVLDSTENKLSLQETIDIASNRDMTARLTSAQIDMKQQLVTTSEPVIMTMGENRIDADTMRIWGKEKRVLFSGHVKVRLVRERTAASSPPAETGAAPATAVSNGINR